MRVLIPQATQNATAIANALQKRGHHSVTLPLVIVERTDKPLIKLEGAQGFIVTSPDGARALADTIGVRTFPVFADSLTTASELERLGFKSVRAAKDDSADLAKLIEKNANPNHGAFIYACSTTAPIQLSALLSNMGFAVRSMPLYSVKRVDPMPPELADTLSSGVDAAVFLSADEARAFVALVQMNQLDGNARKLKVIAANPVVAAPLRGLKLGAVVVPDSGNIESIFNALDKKLIDKVEEERLLHEREAQKAADRKRAEEERQAQERAEKERLEREETKARELENARIAAERAEQERIKQENAERMRAEEAERKRIAEEKAEQEKRARQEAKEERQAIAKAEKMRRAEEKEERKRVARETAAREKVERQREKEQRRAEEAARREKERAEIESQRQHAEAVERARTEEKLKKQQKENEARKQRELEKETQRQRKAENAERLRQEELRRKQEETEKAEQERIEAEKELRVQQKIEVEEKLATEKNETEKTRIAVNLRGGFDQSQSSDESHTTPENTESKILDIDSSVEKEILAPNLDAAPLGIKNPNEDLEVHIQQSKLRTGIAAKLKSWFSSADTGESSTPMFARFAGEHIPQTKSELRSKSSGALDTSMDRDDKSTIPQQSPIQTMDQKERRAPEEVKTVSQDKSPDPDNDFGEKESGVLKDSTPTSHEGRKRSGGRAERLRAEDAADQQAQRQPYRNFDIADSSAERQSSGKEAHVAAPIENTGSGGRVVALFVALVFIAGGIFATASWWVPRATQLIQSAGTSNTDTVLTSADTAPISPPSAPRIQDPVPTTETNTPSVANTGELDALRREFADRLDSIEQREGLDDSSVVSLSDTISSQARQLAAVSARIATLEAAIGNSARLEDLNNRIAVLEGRSADAASVLSLSNRVANLEDVSRRAVAEQTAEVALLMATSQLREALITGRPFSSELETTKALSERVLDITLNDAAFMTYATRGIPSVSELQNQFGEIAAQAVRAAAIPDGTSGWLRQSLDRLLSIITVRRVSGDVAGNSATAIVARAESRLDSGDIAGAITELGALAGAAAEAANPWLSFARARVAANQEITTITNKVLASMALEERSVLPATATAEGE